MCVVLHVSNVCLCVSCYKLWIDSTTNILCSSYEVKYLHSDQVRLHHYLNFGIIYMLVMLCFWLALLFTHKQCVIWLHLFFTWSICSEKSELIYKNHFLTILFPVDRFAEMGPSSRTFFSNNGFTCLQVLDHIHSFYQVRLVDVYFPGLLRAHLHIFFHI